MSVGHKLAARVVVNLSNKRCEAAGVAGQAACKSRATHGDPEEGATACQLHKTDGMVQLKGLGAPVVLDVASAGGEPAITIAKAIPGATVHATDFAPAMMDLIRRRAAEAGVSNVTAAVADGEALTGFGDRSVDAVTCTMGLMFMPNWRRAVQEFSRVLREDGVVAVTFFERHDDSLFQRMREVLEILVPGFKGLVDPEALGEDEGSEVVEEMKAAGLCNVSVSKFSVPVVLSPEAGPRDIWEHWIASSPLGQMMSSLEAKGRANVRQEAVEIFEGRMDEDWAQGRAPLGLQNNGVGSAGSSSAALESPRVFYLRSLMMMSALVLLVPCAAWDFKPRNNAFASSYDFDGSYDFEDSDDSGHSSIQSIFYSEMLNAGDTVELLSHGPFTLVAACTGVENDAEIRPRLLMTVTAGLSDEWVYGSPDYASVGSTDCVGATPAGTTTDDCVVWYVGSGNSWGGPLTGALTSLSGYYVGFGGSQAVGFSKEYLSNPDVLVYHDGFSPDDVAAFPFDCAMSGEITGGGQRLAALLQRGATLDAPSQGPGAPTPPRPPLEAGYQAPGQGAEERPPSAMEAARVPSPAQDQREVTPESPPPSTSGAAAADAVAPPAEFGNWGVDGMSGGIVPPSRTPQGHFGRARGVDASPVTAEAVAQLANRLDRAANIEPDTLEDMFEYAFESDDGNDAAFLQGEHTVTIAADGFEKIKWPRTSSGKVFYAIVPVQWPQTTRGAVRSVFGYAQFSFEPVDPADESEGGAEVEEKADVQGQEADQDEDMHDVNHGYTADSDENGQG
eukprot:g3370.t1